MGLLKIAALTALSWLFWRLLRDILNVAIRRVVGSFGSGAQKAGQVADMVRDPVCGSYVSMDHAKAGDFEGERFYFCSDDCLKTYGEKTNG